MDNRQLAEIDACTAKFTGMLNGIISGNPPDLHDYAQSFAALCQDMVNLRFEVTRLNIQRQETRDLHVPMSASDGKALCTGCSVSGAEVPWPCATWQITDKT